MAEFVKRRGVPDPGSITEALGSFSAEVRFYREIAPEVDIRVPACFQAEETGTGTLLVLEDLSSWQEGADPLAAARALAELHQRWSGQADSRWPWLRPVGAAAGLIEKVYGEIWAGLSARADLPGTVSALGEQLAANFTEHEYATGRAGPLTLVHGDASMRNMRTGPAGEVALLDWEDVSAAPGVLDLAWLLVSSVEPDGWDEVIAAYGPAAGLPVVLPAVAAQGLMTLSDYPAGSPDAQAWIARLAAAAARLTAAG
jgi:aminoglycoside phosphotransferase (APT) family kinase protein